ncbi:hypothetical protein L3X38_036532 [Prunus dulcis]|uniref:Uncharacterized protein n=1 Tax=Prunus dulcis TaxID=3755 RepID=A0AAD4YPR8_PRUDU|nr:hypothetical protein L3X38_036532 [Prunus dulcis]
MEMEEEYSDEYMAAGDDGVLSRVKAELRANKANIRQLQTSLLMMMTMIRCNLPLRLREGEWRPSLTILGSIEEYVVVVDDGVDDGEFSRVKAELRASKAEFKSLMS